MLAMISCGLFTFAAPFVASAVTAGGGDTLLWDNDIVTEPSNARATSPPGFPDIRVMDDFVVDDEAWLITQFWAQTVVDATWEDGGVMEVFVRTHDAKQEAPVRGVGNDLYNVVVPHDREFTGRQAFGRDIFIYWTEELRFVVPAGTHWIGFRHPEAGGQGTSYWTEVPGGPDGIDSYGHRFSLDAGATWVAKNHHVGFELWGVRGATIPLIAYEVTRGEHVGGDLDSLRESDDDALIVEARRPSRISQPSVGVVVSAATGQREPIALAVTVEGAVSAGGAIQWIDLYDFESDAWERFDTRPAPTADTITAVSVFEDAARYVHPTARRVDVRVGYYDLIVPVVGWTGRIDRVHVSVFD